jgi:hypothetical protein
MTFSLRQLILLSSALIGFLLVNTALVAQEQLPQQNPEEEQPTMPPPPAPQSFMDIYGFVQLDLGYDFKVNDPNWFDVNRPSKLPAFPGEFGKNGNTYFSVRQSRFGVKGSQYTDLGELKYVFEFDMFGVGVDAGQTTIRPRHYYGELGPVLAKPTVSSWTLMSSPTFSSTGVRMEWCSCVIHSCATRR